MYDILYSTAFFIIIALFEVYENGKDTGGILVYINKKELENHLGRHPNTVLERVS